MMSVQGINNPSISLNWKNINDGTEIKTAIFALGSTQIRAKAISQIGNVVLLRKTSTYRLIPEKSHPIKPKQIIFIRSSDFEGMENAITAYNTGSLTFSTPDELGNFSISLDYVWVCSNKINISSDKLVAEFSENSISTLSQLNFRVLRNPQQTIPQFQQTINSSQDMLPPVKVRRLEKPNFPSMVQQILSPMQQAVKNVSQTQQPVQTIEIFINTTVRTLSPSTPENNLNLDQNPSKQETPHSPVPPPSPSEFVYNPSKKGLQ